MKQSLSLINELTEEVERVTKQCGEIIVECDERDAERLHQVGEYAAKVKKLTEERDTFREYAYNMQKYVENIKHKEEEGYEPSAARYAAEMEMWRVIALEKKELTEENERLTTNLVEQSAENVMLIGENKRLQKALNTDISIVRVSRGCGKTAHLREVARVRMDAIRADTVREMQELIFDRLDISVEGYSAEEVKSDVRDMVYQIAKEMVEGIE